MNPGKHTLKLRRLGIDTYKEPIIYMREECHVCRAEGFESLGRIRIACGDRVLIATLNKVKSPLLSPGEAGLSNMPGRRWPPPRAS